MEENEFKPTEFDSLVGSRHFQMLKAALPFLSPQEQKAVSLYTKAAEFKKTMQLFQDSDNIPLGACSVDSGRPSVLEMLSALRPYGTAAEQEMLQTFSQILEAASLDAPGKEPVSAMSADSPEDSGRPAAGKARKPVLSLDLFKPLLSPDMQSRLETMQLLFQVMQT